MKVLRDDCREWRLLASCQLDGELSELGEARLRRHVAACADCERWLADARSATELLRACELAPLEHEIRLPALRRRLARAGGLVGAGASAAAAALAAVLVGFPSGTAPERAGLPAAGTVAAPSTGCVACTGADVVLTAFRQALVVPAPGGVRTPYETYE